MSSDAELGELVKAMHLKNGHVQEVKDESRDARSDTDTMTDGEEDDDAMDKDMDSVVDEDDAYGADTVDDKKENTAGADTVDDENEDPAPVRMVRLRHSRFPNRPSTIVFDYPATAFEVSMQKVYAEKRNRTELVVVHSSCGKPPSKTKDGTTYSKGRQVPLRYKSHWLRNSIKYAFKKAGFKQTEGPKWSVSWGKQMPEEEYQKLKSYQRVNHFPDSRIIGHKDRLMELIGSMQRQFGEAYRFIPETFSWPAQKDAILQTMAQDPSGLWILKPPSSSCGRGIKVVQPERLERKPMQKKYIVQKYIANPLLIDGCKFDLRLYVLVTSIHPLRIYLFQAGLARFCTSKYSNNPEHLKNKFGHLTNYCINNKNEAFQDNKEAYKWSLKKLYDRLDAEGITRNAEKEILTPIHDIIIKTMIGAEGHMTPLFQKCVPHRNNCFELYGFDFMIDADLKPWLIEVNILPSITASSPLDKKIKFTLMADVFNLVGFRFSTAEGGVTTLNSKEGEGTNKSKKIPVRKISSARSFWNTKDRELDAKQIEELSDEDWNIILDYEEEMERTGHFTCIFPTSETLSKYQRFFTTPRPHNTLVCRWLRYKEKHQVSYVPPTSTTTNMASCWQPANPQAPPTKKLVSATKLLGVFRSKQKVGLGVKTA